MKIKNINAANEKWAILKQIFKRKERLSKIKRIATMQRMVISIPLYTNEFKNNFGIKIYEKY